jgi:hypothetical protein
MHIAVASGVQETWYGGFVGGVNEVSHKNCYSIVAINRVGDWTGQTVFDGDYVGKPVGIKSFFENCYTVETSAVPDEFFGGALIADSTVTSCYWQGTDGSTNNGAVGKTEAKLKLKATFTGWSFNTIWNISSGTNDGYPFLDVRGGKPTIFGNSISIYGSGGTILGGGSGIFGN